MFLIILEQFLLKRRSFSLGTYYKLYINNQSVFCYQLDIYFLEATFRVYSLRRNTKLYVKYMHAIFGDQFY